jgi:phosphate:Na+ symporter
LGLNIQQMLFEFLGGLGIFLFAIKFIGDGLQKSAGDRLRDILDKYTTNPFMGVLAGILATVLIQSSSATAVLTVGLVSAGFMTLRQAIGVIIGANIGTTVTAFIIGLDVGEFALPIIAVGAVMLFFFKNKKVNNAGQILFGIGALFHGLELMNGGMAQLREVQDFYNYSVTLSSNPIIGVIAGTIFTAVAQSSSATIGILQGMYAESLLSLDAALPVLFGDNIGTTIAAILASIGASVSARRAATAHVLFNIMGTVMFMILLAPFTSLVEFFQSSLRLNPEMTIAFAHGTFNLTNALIQLPFIGVLAFVVTKLVPGQDLLVSYTKQLDPIFIEQSPSIALGQAKEEVMRMGEFAVTGLEETNQFLKTKHIKHADAANQIEDAINSFDRKITDYLILLTGSSLSENESEEHSILMNCVRDIERIGDHFENITELVDFQLSNKVIITDHAMKDLEEMFVLTLATVKESLVALGENDKKAAQGVMKKEMKIDKMERKLRKQHIQRINEGLCNGQAGIVYVDILSNLERIGDHAVNLAEAVIGEQEH